MKTSLKHLNIIIIRLAFFLDLQQQSWYSRYDLYLSTHLFQRRDICQITGQAHLKKNFKNSTRHIFQKHKCSIVNSLSVTLLDKYDFFGCYSSFYEDFLYKWAFITNIIYLLRRSVSHTTKILGNKVFVISIKFLIYDHQNFVL